MENSSVTCPACQAANSAGSRFCNRCGRPLPENLRCRWCQTLNSREASVCSGCGVPLPVPQAQPGADAASTSSKKQKTKPQQRGVRPRYPLIVFGLLGAGAVIFLFIYLRSTRPPIPSKAGQSGEEAALAEINRLLSANDRQTAYRELVLQGNQAMDSQRFPEAILYYTHALAIDSSAVDVRVDLGACYHFVGENQKAKGEFLRALNASPQHLVALFNLGVVYHGLGQKDSARVVWQKYLRLAPNGPLVPQIQNLLSQQ